jgi:ABC-type antimicrobial peptide transport system permease subunit
MNYDFNNNNNDNDYLDREKVSPQTERKIKRLFLILVSVGLVLGVIAAVGVVKMLNQFGLTEKTPQFEHIKE